MSLWIKICGNTSFADAQLAAEAGADAVGFVFAPSPRRVTIAQAAAIVPNLPPALEKIGVFVDAPFDETAAAVESCALTGVQLHFAAPPDLPARLREEFGTKLRILRVIHFGGANTVASSSIFTDLDIDNVLVDSSAPTAAGGTGLAYDWTAARHVFEMTRASKPLIAAGGLTPSNVAEAIATLHPWGVDVVSGVESAPGRKDPAKVRAFIANARRA